MAQEAHKEPTMEEILASIRKIISDDSPEIEAPEPVEPETTVDDFTLAKNETFPELAPEADLDNSVAALSTAAESVDDDIFADLANENVAEDDVVEALNGVSNSDVEPDVAIANEESENVFELGSGNETTEPAASASPSFEELMSAPESPVEATETAPVETPTIEEEAPMEATNPTPVNTNEDSSLVATETASVAAGALEKLKAETAPAPRTATVDEDGRKSLEALTRELMKPMLKEWLDNNLASIVEERVDAEVRRIAGISS